MQFLLIDRITQLTLNKEIAAVKALSLAEEYLADHFPSFPVMPGVLMIEAMTQAGAWLIRASEDFAHSMVTLKEVRNAKYGRFVEPGEMLEVSAKIVEQNERTTLLKVQGRVAGQTSVRAQLHLERFNLRDAKPAMASTDEMLISDQKKQFALLWRPHRAARAPQGAST